MDPAAGRAGSIVTTLALSILRSSRTMPFSTLALSTLGRRDLAAFALVVRGGVLALPPTRCDVVIGDVAGDRQFRRVVQARGRKRDGVLPVDEGRLDRLLAELLVLLGPQGGVRAAGETREVGPVLAAVGVEDRPLDARVPVDPVLRGRCFGIDHRGCQGDRPADIADADLRDVGPGVLAPLGIARRIVDGTDGGTGRW